MKEAVLSNFGKCFNIFYLLFLITSFELLTVSIYYPTHVTKSIITACLLTYFFSLALRLLREKRLASETLSFTSANLAVAVSTILLSIFFVLYAVFVREFAASVKYSVYAVFFILMTFFERREILLLLVKAYIIIVGVLCLATNLQFALLTFLDWDVDQFSVVLGLKEYLHRGEVPYVNPFQLGLLRVEDAVQIGPIQFLRFNSYTTESKFFSLLIILALGFSSLINFPSNKSDSKKISSTIFFSALFLSHAYTSLAIILLAFVFYFIISRNYFSLKVKTLIIFCTPHLTVFTFGLVKKIASRIGGFASARLNSFTDGFIGLQSFSWRSVAFLSDNAYWDSLRLPNYALMLFRYGYLGTAVYFTFLITVIYAILKQCRDQSASYILAVSLLLSAIFTLPFFFFSQPLTLLVCFSFSILLNGAKLKEV